MPETRRKAGAALVAAGTLLAVLGPPSPAPAAGFPATFTLQGPAGITGGQVEGLGGQNSPVAGAVKAVVTSPTDANVMWVGTVNGGVWRTNNATSGSPSWTPQTDRESSLSIGALDMDPTIPTNLVLVAGLGRWSSLSRTGGALNGILRTTNGGTSWTALGAASLTGEDLSGVAPRGSTIVVTSKGGLGGVWRSTNTGSTFTRLSGNGTSGLPAGIALDIAGDPGNNNRLYVAVAGASGGVFRSDDAGATWTALGGGTFGGATGTNLATAADNVKLSVHNDATTNAVYAAVDNGGALAGLFRSTDAGATWTALDRPQTIEGGTPVGLQPDEDEEDEEEDEPGGQGGIHLSMVADPGDANVVYLGGDRQPRGAGGDGVLGTNDDSFPNSIGANNFSGRLFRCDASLAAGAQCTPLTHSGTANNSSPHADSRDMAFDANGAIIETDDGGVYRRTSPGNASGDWFSVIGNLATSETHSCDFDHVAHVAICGDQDTGVPEQPSTGATTWREVSQADGGNVAVDDVAAPSTRYFSNQNLGGFTRRSCNAGNSCSNAAPALNVSGTGQNLFQFDTNIQFYNPIAVNAVASGRLIIATNTVYESTDQGDNLTRLTGFTGSATTAIAYGGRSGGTDNADVLYVGSSTGLFLRTAAGTSVSRLTAYPGGRPADIALDPEDWLSAYVVDNNTVWHTPDGGATWTDITGDLGTIGASNFRSVAFLSGASPLVAVAANDGVYASQAGKPGQWAKLTGALPNGIAFDLAYDRTDDVLLVATLGRSAWTVSNPAALLPSADLEVTKVGRPDPVNAGQKLFYDVTVTNHGPDTAVNTVVTDQLPPAVTYVSDSGGCTASGGVVTCHLGDLPNGAVRTFTITTLVKPDAVAGSSTGGGTLHNTVSVSSASGDPNPANDSATTTTQVQDQADLAVTKLCQPGVALRAGQTGTCTVFVDNFGPSTARDVTITDTHASNGSFTFGTITPSQGTCDPPTSGLITCHLGLLPPATPTTTGRATVTIQLTATEAQTIDDTAKAVSDTTDPDVTNNSSVDTITISASADLALTKTGPATVTAGTNATYVLTATNHGVSTATGVTVSDALPAGVQVVSVSGGGGCTAGTPGDPLAPARCSFGVLAPGASASMTVVVRVDPGTTGILHDDGRVDSDVFDPDTSNNLVHVDTTVNTSADLALTIAATPNPVIAGNALSYQLTVTNTGPSVSRNVVLTDPIPSSEKVDSTSTSTPSSSCDLQVNTNTVQCQLGDLDPGRSAVITIYVTVAAATPPGSIVDTASVTATTGDPATANNTASVTTPVITRADLTVTLASDADVYKPSKIIHYTITVTNHGPSDAQSVVVTQVLPDPKVATYDSNSGGCPPPSGTTFTCPLGKIAAGGSKSFQLNILIRGNKGTISQTATVTSATTDPVLADNSSTRVVTVK